MRYVFKPHPELTGGDKKANVCEVQKDEIVEYLVANSNFRQYVPKPKPAVAKARQVDDAFTGEQQGA